MRVLMLTLALLSMGSTVRAAIVLSNFRANMSWSTDPETGDSLLSLVVDSSRFGAGGIAAGQAAVEGNPPDDGIWLADPFLGQPPDDGVPAITFRIGFDGNPAGEVMGIDPEPFRIFLQAPPDDARPTSPTLIGWLDFTRVSGFLGSLHLSGVVLHAVDATGAPVLYDVDPFTIEAVPEPSAIIIWGLFGAVGAAAAAIRRRRNRRPRRLSSVGQAVPDSARRLVLHVRHSLDC